MADSVGDVDDGAGAASGGFTPSLCHFSALSRCHCVTMSLCHSSALSSCHPVVHAITLTHLCYPLWCHAHHSAPPSHSLSLPIAVMLCVAPIVLLPP